RHGSLTPIFAQTYLALACVVLGDIDRGLAYGRDAVQLAEQRRHPHTICNALAFLAGAHVRLIRSPNERSCWPPSMPSRFGWLAARCCEVGQGPISGMWSRGSLRFAKV